MKLSVIICVYNTALSFLEECLLSIRNSTLREGEYEILAVDDGSEIDYTELFEKYGVRSVRTENRGMLAARNTGISEARGEYTVFVDSDDTVSFNYHRPMLMAAEESGADIVMGDWAFHTERARYFCYGDSTIKKNIDISGRAELLSALISQGGREHSYFVLWNKLYRTELLRRGVAECKRIEKPGERFNFSEDTLRNFYAYRDANRLINLHTGYYFYRIHASQSVNVVSHERLLSQIECIRTTFDTMEREVRGMENEGELVSGINSWRALTSRTHYSYAERGGYTDLYGVIKESYGVNELRRSTFHDGSAYSNNRMLPTNLTELDLAMLLLCRGEMREVTLRGAGKYTRRMLTVLFNSGDLIKSHTGVRLPKERYRLMTRIIMHPVIYALGMLLFPKGSRIRAFLKRKL